MKKLFSAILCVVSLNAFSQASKWFVTVSVGGTVCGPAASIKNQMKKQGFDDTGTSNFLGWTSTTDYPDKMQDPSLLVTFGIKQNNHRTLYFTLGQLEKSEVWGLRNTGYSDFLGIIGGSDGPTPVVKYTTYQLTAGYMYSFAKSRVKLGVGPSLFFVKYASGMSYTVGETKTTVMPGVSGSARLPLGKEKKMFGVELFVETNIAPPVKMDVDEHKAEYQFQMKSANMISANFGIAFRLHDKANKK
jgi:hypothetical protein